jgi:choline dehydrogenase-like flavoprotein
MMAERTSSFDTVVVGSGAAGGMAAYALATSGVSVLMLEAGRDYDAVAEAPMFNTMQEAPLHGMDTPDKEAGYYDATIGGAVIPGEPYTVAEDSRFYWWRARMLGGRTNHWGRMSLRFGPYDFEGASRDGLGIDWPLSYDELAPYYDRVEALIGVFGGAEGIENSPDSPPGLLHDPPQPRAFEAWMKMVMEGKHGIPVVPAHMAILTRPHGDRPPCFYATDCQRGCAIRANFQSPTVLIPPALATGNLTIRTSAHVYEVTLDARGRASGVRFIDTKTGAAHHVEARSVVLGASTCETARILLQSKSAGFPDGLANSSGHVGRNLIDTPSFGLSAQVPQLEDLPAFHDEGVTLYHVYSPWWGYAQQRAGQLNFPRGYHLEFWGGRRMPEFRDMLAIARRTRSCGSELHEDMRRLYGSIVSLAGRGEMIPNADSYIELDPETKDRYGLPVPRFHWRWGRHELDTCEHIRTTIAGIFKSMNADIIGDLDRPIEESMRAGGSTIHEAGTARMSCSPQAGVLDRHCRTWDVPNLYVVDGSAFPSMPDKNPTLTILALAWRAADHLTASLAKRDV